MIVVQSVRRRLANQILAISLLSVLLTLGTSSAFATTLEIQFSGLNLSYDGSTISDSASPLGGTGDPNDADPLDVVQFKVNGVQAGSTLTSDIAIDISIPDVLGISDVDPSSEILTTGNPGYFDLLIGTAPSAAQFLRLDTTSVSVNYINSSSTIQFLFGAAVASIDAQDLPFSLTIGAPVTVFFSTQVDLGSKVVASDVVTGFTSTGTGGIVGVPEPASCVLAALGLAAVCLRRRV